MKETPVSEVMPDYGNRAGLGAYYLVCILAGVTALAAAPALIFSITVIVLLAQAQFEQGSLVFDNLDAALISYFVGCLLTFVVAKRKKPAWICAFVAAGFFMTSMRESLGLHSPELMLLSTGFAISCLGLLFLARLLQQRAREKALRDTAHMTPDELEAHEKARRKGLQGYVTAAREDMPKLPRFS